MPRATLGIQVQSLEGCDDLEPINAAIAHIQAAGFEYEVGSLETTIEGDDAAELMQVADRCAPRGHCQGPRCDPDQHPPAGASDRPADTMRERVAPFRSQTAGLNIPPRRTNCPGA